ncbi:MAG: DEAD/DEAH box helicase [Acidimicrobiales bacterium]
MTLLAPRSSGSFDVTFVRADPPRASRFAIFGEAEPGGAAPEGAEELLLELVLPLRGDRLQVRRRRVPARALSAREALDLLADLPPGEASDTARAWSAILTAGLGLIARGRLQPAATPSGADAWIVGPLDPADLRLLGSLAATLPPLGHGLCEPGVTPLRIASPSVLVRSAWDCLADSLVRTAAASKATGIGAFASQDVTDVSQLRPWLAEATGTTTKGASVSLRVELDDELRDGPDGDEASGGLSGRAVLQMTSVADPSLVVDAAELFTMPAAVLSRYGAEAEADLLLALRRGSRVWPPLGSLLTERSPTGLELDDELTADLLLDGSEALKQAGIEVLWPAELVSDRLVLRAVATPAPGAVVGAGLDLGTLLEFRWQVALAGEILTGQELEALSEAKRGVVRLRGRFVVADPALIARAAERRARRATAAEALGALLAGKLEVDGELFDVASEGTIGDVAANLRALASGGIAEIDVPARLVAELRPYQRRGMAWLKQMSDLGLGACLADDMGLGKTIQVIALHLLRADASLGPSLVVCPTSLLGNWERELQRFAPSVPVRRFHGGDRHLDDLAIDEVVLTTYGVLRRERARLAAAGLAMVVADEVQHAKNPLSETARALRSLPAPTRVALTGTPVENRLSELWSILDWTTPGLLGPLERFRRTVAVAIERNRDPDATERLTAVVRPFLLRRRKTDPEIAPNLPERTVTDLPVPLTTEQASLYQAEVKETLAAIEEREGIARQGLVLRLLTALKQICNHPAQYLHQPGPLAGRSGKLAALEELLDVILAEGDSVLVFSQFVEMCALVQARLEERGIATLFLHGGVAAKAREEMVARFQSGVVPVFLLSLRAGGVGLNLTRATHVIHYDRWWNPAVEDQASDRAHRIGQLRAVQIHRLICEGTLEDRIAQILEKKRDLADAVVGEGESWVGDLSDEELAELVALGALEESS